jgi:hypothetical protein
MIGQLPNQVTPSMGNCCRVPEAHRFWRRYVVGNDSNRTLTPHSHGLEAEVAPWRNQRLSAATPARAICTS